jgi:FkbM family methyltransferase
MKSMPAVAVATAFPLLFLPCLVGARLADRQMVRSPTPTVMKSAIHNATKALPQRMQVKTRRLGANSSTKATFRMAGHDGKLPCFCETSNPSWKRSTRTAPKCLFIDLGAADGNSFGEFMSGKFGPVENCPSGGQWEAILVEANPRFTENLQEVQKKYQKDKHGVVDALPSTAAFMCQGWTSFYLDTSTGAEQNNYWASSMSADSNAGKEQRVEVPTVNLNRILYEMAIPADWVMVKMDIEGSEWDMIPCLAQAESASLMDRLYVEVHPNTWGLTGTDQAELEAAEARLRRRGVDIPPYFSQTL